MFKHLTEIIEQIDKTNTNATALLCGKQKMTYGELALRSQQLAHALKIPREPLGARVAILLPKSFDGVAAILACLRNRVPYIPVDCFQPAARIRRILVDCEPSVIVTTRAILSEKLLDGHNTPVLLIDDITIAPTPQTGSRPHRDPDDLAFVLYTSGSTGNPKGVMITHRNLLTFINWALNEFDLHDHDVFANVAQFAFDISTFDLYASLAVGASIRIYAEHEVKNPLRLAQCIEEDRITVWYSVPSTLCLMLAGRAFERHDCSSLRYILFAGEVFPIKHLRTLRRMFKNASLYNLYGPTETNVCTYYRVEDIPAEQMEPVPIGRPLPGARVWLRDAAGRRVSGDGVGELVVEGPCVTSGYWKRDDDGNAANHRKGVHATGDLVSLRDGELVYHGRLDDMVKVGGFRIELAEVEQALSSHPDIQAVAVVPARLDERVVLCACYVASSSLSVMAIRQHCARFLPTYMIPQQAVRFDGLPLNANGKVDRLALAEGVAGRQQ